MNIRRPLGFLMTVLVLFIPACSQVPAPDTDNTIHLGPQAFGTPASESTNGLAKYSSGVYVVGFTLGSLHGAQQGRGDAFIRKVDVRGQLIWGRQFGTAANDVAYDVATDAGGNAYVFGRTSGNLARGLQGLSDFFVRKYTPSGSVAWTRQMGLDTYDQPGGVVVSGNNVYMVGTSGDIGMFVYRFNLNGETIWKRQFSTPTGEYFATGAADITVDGNGNVYVAGEAGVPGIEGFRFSDVKINKYNTSGTLQWSKYMDSYEIDSVQAITAYGNDIYVVMNAHFSTDCCSLAGLFKLDGAGVTKWSRDLGNAESYDEGSARTSISADSSGVYAGISILTYGHDGEADINHYEVRKFRVDGSLGWNVRSPIDLSNRNVNAILARGNGDVYIAGAADHGVSRGYDAFIKRLDAATGSTVWK